MKPRILITGASGFIGSHLVDAAVSAGHEVWAGIRKSSSTTFLHREAHPLYLDFSSVEKLTSSLQTTSDGWDYVIHNAGITFAKRPAEFQVVNADYTNNLVEAVSCLKHPVKKFILIGSLAAYGPGDAKTMKPLQIGDKPHPVSRYGRSKLNAELLVKEQKHFPWLVINPTAVYGPRDRDFLEFVNLVNGGWELYLGSHEQKISMIYGPELAEVVVSLTGTDVVNQSFMVSDGGAYSKEELGQIVREELGRKTRVIRLPLGLIRSGILAVESVYRLLGTLPFLNSEKLNEISQANWLCDSDPVWKLLGRRPRVDLNTGMRNTIQWYRDNGWLKK